MSRITRPVRRETNARERGRNVVIELHPEYAVVRLKGQRTRYCISYEGIYWAAAKAEAERQKREKRA